ncbi:MAG: Rrf2 family transcriptional regulator, partial [Coriobacteriales bacterium]
MDITRRTDYAIRIMTALTAARSDVPVSLRELAGVQDVPYAFARNVQRDLMTAGLITTARGATGGLALARPAEQ